MAARKQAETKENVMNEEVEAENVNNDKRELEADKIIKNHMLGSLAFGAVPLPLIDLVGLTTVQLNMLRKLSNLYGHTFSEELAKKAIASLLGSGLTLPVAAGLFSLVKIIPVIGQSAGVVALGSTAAASTYAIGRVFVKHFESGGDFLSFNSKKAKEEFKEEFDKGKEAASELKEEKAAA